VVVLDDAELPDDLARDLTEVLTFMRARLYGRRPAGQTSGGTAGHRPARR
jgi:putative resolvase